jgi:LDH2 family malate/lactate/ureidoglycolate dehydrogenase
MQPEEGFARLQALGFGEMDARRLWQHFDDAEQRGKLGHGYSRIVWLESQTGFDPRAEPMLVESSNGFERWDGNGAIGYLVMMAAVEKALWNHRQGEFERARLIVCDRTFPTGMLGYYARVLASQGLVALLTATSPARLGPPDGPKVAGTNPLAIGIPSSDGDPLVADVSMGAVTWGDVIAGLRSEDELVPFGGEQWHKAFALAVGLQLLVDSLVREEGHGAVLLVARPEADPVPALRELAAGVRLPGDG